MLIYFNDTDLFSPLTKLRYSSRLFINIKPVDGISKMLFPSFQKLRDDVGRDELGGIGSIMYSSVAVQLYLAQSYAICHVTLYYFFSDIFVSIVHTKRCGWCVMGWINIDFVFAADNVFDADIVPVIGVLFGNRFILSCHC